MTTTIKIDYLEETYLLDITSGNIDIENLDISTAVIEIQEPSENTITLETSIWNTLNNIEIYKYNDYDLTLTNTVYANLPDEIPMSIITGDLHVSRIQDLDEYLTTIPIDGGSP